MRCTRCNGRCGTFGHYQRFCLKTRTATAIHFCCPGMPCEVDELAATHEGQSVIQALQEALAASGETEGSGT